MALPTCPYSLIINESYCLDKQYRPFVQYYNANAKVRQWRMCSLGSQYCCSAKEGTWLYCIGGNSRSPTDYSILSKDTSVTPKEAEMGYHGVTCMIRSVPSYQAEHAMHSLYIVYLPFVQATFRSRDGDGRIKPQSIHSRSHASPLGVPKDLVHHIGPNFE